MKAFSIEITSYEEFWRIEKAALSFPVELTYKKENEPAYLISDLLHIPSKSDWSQTLQITALTGCNDQTFNQAISAIKIAQRRGLVRVGLNIAYEKQTATL